ncbi:MAG: Endonuclease/exonuclease/phosphatase [Verrucomicrobiales bacterium]|nr:Endonuclease/exonuclease/phosphatase [Verrucomicrobiales bacterium]
MNAFVILRFNLVPGHIGMSIQLHGHISHEIFDKNRVFISPFGNGLLIFPLQQGKQLGTGRALHQSNEVFNPNGLFGPDLNGHLATLVMGSVGADRFGTGTKGSDSNLYREHEIDFLPAGRRIKAGSVIQHAFPAGNRRLLGQKEGKLHLQVAAIRMQFFLHGKENVFNVLNMNHAAMSIKHLDKAAHMGAFELLGQVNKHADGGHRVLHHMRLVPNLDRKAQSPDTDFVDAEFTCVPFALLIVQFGFAHRIFCWRRLPNFAHFQHAQRYQEGSDLQKLLQKPVFWQNWLKFAKFTIMIPAIMRILARPGTITFPIVLLFLSSNISVAERFRVACFNLNNYLTEASGNRPLKSAASKAKIRESLQALKADVVSLEEVGSTNALLELRDALNGEGLNYPYWDHVQGADTNIHVAVLSRFPITGRRPHTNDSFLFFGKRFQVSRGFSEVDIQVNSNYSFTLIGVHLKSRLPVPDGDETDIREQEALILKEKVDAILSAKPKANLVVLGDFNDIKDSKTLKTLTGRQKLALVDTRPAEKNGDDQPNPNPRYAAPRVTWTYYYAVDDSFSRIDYILLSRGMAREWDPEETYVLSLPNWGVASDHRPIVATFEAVDK